MATNQAIMASLAGATYASIFFARIGDMGYEATTVIKDTRVLLDDGQMIILAGRWQLMVTMQL